MTELDSISSNTVSYRFIFHPIDKHRLNYLLRRDSFEHPVWIDVTNEFFRMNSLPKE